MGVLKSAVGSALRKAGFPGAAAAAPAAPAPAFNALDVYASAAPSAQLAVDVFQGEWSSELPAHLGVTAGHAALFADSRIERAVEWLGPDIEGARVLELGPLEGGHTYMLERAGADVFAIESNSRAFLKCLVVKELLGLKRARFVRGDFVAYLRDTTDRYDVAVASGVLYHMVDPLELLNALAAVSDRLVIWTHYFDGDIIANSPLARQFQHPAESIPFGDRTYSVHPREYLEALEWGGFCGGPETYARWMERADILDALKRLGFGDVEISHDAPDHVNGPSFLLLARK